jgi:hypothetical protein
MAILPRTIVVYDFFSHWWFTYEPHDIPNMEHMLIHYLVELVGYAARCKSANETPNWELGPYIIQSIFLLVAPALFAATIYMELGRIVEMIDGEGRVMIGKKWMTKIFVTGDILSFFLQGGGW